MFDDEKMLQETSEAEDIENEDISAEEDEVWEFEDDEENVEATEDADEADNAEETETEADEDSKEETDSGNEKDTEQTAQEDTNPDALFPGEFEIDGVTRQVTMNEAAGLVRKGLLYSQQKEKYLGKLKDAYADPRIAFVDELATAAGQKAEEYMANIRMQKEYNSLIETYGSLEDVPASVMEMFTANAEAKKQQIEAEVKAQKDRQWEETKLAELEDFMENHPEIKEIPKEALALVAKGQTLEGAYAITELSKALKQISDLTKEKAELEKSIKVLKQNDKNKKTKLPSSRSNAVKEDELVWEVD